MSVRCDKLRQSGQLQEAEELRLRRRRRRDKTHTHTRGGGDSQKDERDGNKLAPKVDAKEQRQDKEEKER